ncbi:MAG TPA: hypothetical protein VGO89_04400 [Streptomyces sp.]|nr:hypothetical protein [Streptomyces sp.]
MVADRLAQVVRQQLGLGRLLPLGDAADGAWLVETAAVTTLRAAVSLALPNVRLGSVRIAPAIPEATDPPTVPAPPSALPPGPMRLEADFAVTADAPLTAVAERLRTALLSAAGQELGLRVTSADLRVTDLLERPDDDAIGETHDDRHATEETAQDSAVTEAGRPQLDANPPAPADYPRATATAEAVIAVPGVTRLAPVLGSGLGGLPPDAVSVTDRRDPERGRHLQIQIAVAEGTRALDVARAVRRAAAKAAAWDAPEPTVPVTVAVLVTAIDPAIGSGGERTEEKTKQTQ